MPKARREKAARPLRHNPLAEQIEEGQKTGVRAEPRKKTRAKVKQADEFAEEEEAGRTPAGVAKKVLEMARSQKADDEDEFGDEFPTDERSFGDADVDEEIEDVEIDEEGFIVTEGATEEEERALSLFLPGKAGGSSSSGPTLADMILQKIQEHEARGPAGAVAEDEMGSISGEAGLSPKVIQVYGEIGKWLKHYKSGKLPKAFKVVPSLVNWEEVLALTNPLSWSPAAMYEAVNIFASNLNPRMAQRFFNLVLLPAVRQNIAEHKKLNFHYYRSLRKALFKPAAFFKGIVLPWTAEQCTLREALILSSVLSKASVPVMHVAATLVRLCCMTPWYGTTSILIAALINKKYALPLRVVESLVAHFCAFTADDRLLPLVWHRALLLFMQRYKFDLSDDQRRRIKELLRVHFHDAVGPEVRRELLAPKPGEVPPSGITSGGAAAAMDIG